MFEKQSIFTLFDMQPPAVPKASDILLVRIMRSGTAASDTYDMNRTDGTGAANLMLIAFDCHYRQNSAGTIYEYHN